MLVYIPLPNGLYVAIQPTVFTVSAHKLTGMINSSIIFKFCFLLLLYNCLCIVGISSPITAILLCSPTGVRYLCILCSCRRRLQPSVLQPSSAWMLYANTGHMSTGLGECVLSTRTSLP